MTQEEYLIGELAEKAHVTVRTIRYYLDEGLLPAPAYRSKYALFSQEHLERLELIRRLKELHLPLEEIKQILAAADDQEIDRLLNAQARPSQPAAAPMMVREQAPGKAALEYIDRLRAGRSAVQKREDEVLYPPKVEPPEPRKTPEAKGEFWERIRLAEGVELNVRVTEDPDLRAKIEELVRVSKGLFKDFSLRSK
jgi:DNA-binding transcriptional MerR regulator